MKLLLLEDDDLLAESLAESLKDNGYLVDLAASLKAAKSLMATEDYELAILDVGLPDGSGLDLLAHWRKQKRSTPILVLTAREKIRLSSILLAQAIDAQPIIGQMEGAGRPLWRNW